MRTRWRGGAPCGETASRTPLPGQPALPAPEGDWSRRGAWMRRQIDTGPVLVPDLSRRFTPTIAAFSLGTPPQRGQTVAELAFVVHAMATSESCARRIHRDDLHAPARGRHHPRAADGAAAARRGDGAALQRAALAAGAELAGGRGVTVGRSPKAGLLVIWFFAPLAINH